MTRYAIFLALFALARPATPDPQIDKVIRELKSEVRPGEAMDRMYRVYRTDRWFTFPKFQETAEYLKSEMNAIGLKDVELVPTPADGVTQYGFWTMPLAWDVKQATLEIVEPNVPPSMRVLADYQKIPASLGMWSGPTPAGGITAEVAELRTSSPAEIEKADLKGKWVMVRQGTAGRKLELIRKGAIGVINASTEEPLLRDGHWWVNAWGDAGWGFTKKSTPLPCFSITPRQADAISDMLARGAKVRVKGIVDSRYYSGSYPYTTGVIQGGGTEEEVLELGHTTEQGATDNAAGVAIMLESVAMLNRLIEGGKLTRPRRSIRILAMPELYASMHYIASNPERVRRTVGAMCLDTPAGPYQLAASEFVFALNPDVARSYTDALALRVAESYFSTLGAPRFFHWSPYRTGTDTYLSDPMIGVPTVWPYSPFGRNSHHNSEDTPQEVDALSMRDMAVVTAAFLYTLASAGDADVPWLAEITAGRGYENILHAAEPYLERVEAASKPEELGRALYDGLEHIAYASDREEEATLSTIRLATAEGRERVRASLQPTVDAVGRFAREQSGRLTQAANRRAASLGIATPVKAVAPAADPRYAEASRMIVKRKRFGSITLDDLPPDQREGQPSGAWDAMLNAALNWCDGKRNLAEVIRLTSQEHGPLRFNLVSYFRFLARHGYVELITQ